MLVEVGYGLGVVRLEIRLGNLVDPGADNFTEDLTTRLTSDRVGDHPDGVLWLDEAK